MDDIDQIREELAALRAEHEQLLARLDALGLAGEQRSTADRAVPGRPVPARPESARPESGDRSSSRPRSGDLTPSRPLVGRRLVLAGAAASLGAAIGVGASSASPAAAAGTLPIENGQSNEIRRQTSLTNTGTGPAGPTGPGVDLDDTDVMLVVDNSGSARSGAAGAHVVGRTRALSASTTVGGTVIDARAGATDGVGVAAVANGPGGVGVIASGATAGLRALGGSIGGEFSGVGYGLVVSGGRPLVFLGGHGTIGPPSTTGTLGEVAFDLTGALYLCVASGSPGVWRSISGPAAAGAFHLLPEPRRVYDSRPGAAPVGPSNGGPKGPIADGETRRIDCTANGAPVPTDVTGLQFNLAVTSTNAAGFLTAWGDGGRPLSSAMNWSQESTTLSNSVTIAAGTNATFQLFCGGGGLAHVIVDLAGYYR